MSRMEKLGVVLGVVGGIAAFVGFTYALGIAGTSDMEQYTQEYISFGWLVKHELIGLLVFASGAGLIIASNKLIELSHKEFRKVLVRNTVTNKVTEKFVGDGSGIVLEENEVVWKISKDVYHFQ